MSDETAAAGDTPGRAGTDPMVWILAVIIVGIAVVMLLPNVGSRPAPWRISCSNNLKQIGFALDSYRSRHNYFPSFNSVDADGRPTHSWLAILLPYMEQQAIAELYDFTQPWNSSKNKFASTRIIPSFICPAIEDEDEEEIPRTCYIALPGPGRLFDGALLVQPDQVTDGLDNTIVAVDCPRSKAWWADPLNGQPPEGVRLETFLKWAKESNRHVNVLFADGHVEHLPDNVGVKTLEALLTIAGGEEVVHDDKAWTLKQR